MTLLKKIVFYLFMGLFSCPLGGLFNILKKEGKGRRFSLKMPVPDLVQAAFASLDGLYDETQKDVAVALKNATDLINSEFRDKEMLLEGDFNFNIASGFNASFSNVALSVPGLFSAKLEGMAFEFSSSDPDKLLGWLVTYQKNLLSWISKTITSDSLDKKYSVADSENSKISLNGFSVSGLQLDFDCANTENLDDVQNRYVLKLFEWLASNKIHGFAISDLSFRSSHSQDKGLFEVSGSVLQPELKRSNFCFSSAILPDTGSVLSLDNIKFVLGDESDRSIHLSGAYSFTPACDSNAKPTINADIKVTYLDLDALNRQLYSLFHIESGKELQDEILSKVSQRVDALCNDDPGHNQCDELPRDILFLKSLPLFKINVFSEWILFLGQDFTRANFILTNDGDSLSFSPFNLNLLLGQAGGTCAIHYNQNPNWEIEGALSDIAIEKILPASKIGFELRGGINSEFKFQGDFDEFKGIPFSASGLATVALDHGRVNEFNLLKTNIPGITPPRRFGIEEASVNLKVEDGVIFTKGLNFEAQSFSIGGDGYINLKTMGLQLKLHYKPKILPFKKSFVISGPLLAPKIEKL